MTPRRGIAILTLLLAIGGCAQGPFVDRGEGASVSKVRDTIRETGTFIVCHADESPATLAQVEALAREQCAAYGFEPLPTRTDRYQCRLLAPHRTVYQCVDPAMRDRNGTPVNPFDKKSVEAWKKDPHRPPAATPHAATPPATTPYGPVPVPQAPADAGGGFTLEPGSWGRAFEDEPPTPAAR